MNRESTVSYCSLSSFPRKRESRGGKAAAVAPLFKPQALDPRFRGAFAGAAVTRCEDRLDFEPGHKIGIADYSDKKRAM
jgi:hypothetical protein